MLYHLTKSVRIPVNTALAALLCSSAMPLAAQTQDTPSSERPPEDDLHDRRIDQLGTIIVSAAGLSQLDVLAGTSVLEGAELQANLDGQIGEVLAKLPGVSATSFSPGASRPVLRGFAGERVRVLVDGIGAIDVSNTSADHAVTIDPLTAERVEVLRGPAVLLYGSQAIGGAVNIIDKRIPRRIPDEPVHFDAIASLDTAANLREGGASFDVPIADRFAFHASGSYRQTDDVELAGFSVAPELRRELLEEAAEDAATDPEEAEELREAAEQFGLLPNSATETWSANAGLGFIDDRGSFGVAVGLYDTQYGVPGRPGTGHAHGEEEGGEEEEGEEGEEQVSIDLRQFRTDFTGEVELGDGPFSQLRLRAGYSDYTHTEFEGEEVGTVFDVQGLEARAELTQADRGGWRGSLGAQYTFRDFVAEGEEAFVPANLTEQFALFALQEYGPGPLQVEMAARYETASVKAQRIGFERSFDTVSGALGLAYEGDDALRIGVNLSRVERAPSAEELYSDGPHIATQAFEIGDVNLQPESAIGVEAFARGRVGTVRFSVAAFRNWFDDYIYQVQTGEERDDLPVFLYTQADADYYGFEGEVSVPLFFTGGFEFIGDLRGDYVRAELDDGSPLPRIPPLSLLGALEAQSDALDARVEVQWFDDQTRTAPFETATDGFTYLNASLAWRPIRGDSTLSLLLKGENLLDATGRRHASVTKDFVPLAGRNIKLSARISF